MRLKTLKLTQYETNLPSYRFLEREPLSTRDNEDESLHSEFKKQTPRLKFSRNKSQGHFREVYKWKNLLI